MECRNHLSWTVFWLVLFVNGIATDKVDHTQVDSEDDTHVDLLPSGSNKITSSPIKSNTPSSCLQNEYGPSCTYCVPHDTCLEGHYTCDTDTGTRLCRPGWHGNDCRETDRPVIHDYNVTCPENQCRNGGSCGSNKCCCVEGFTGVLCEIEIIECTNDTCANEGICRDTVGSFTCLCRPQFGGERCEKRIDTDPKTTIPSRDSNCQRDTCKNNGRCFEDAFYTYCVCPTGFTGTFCETNLMSSNHSIISCPENRYGVNCNIICIPQDNCYGGHFVCHPSTGSRLCLRGWIGKNCNTRLLPQNLDPMCPKNMGCKNDGQCFKSGCCCKHNYTGEFCNVESIGCLSNPCVNNATCTTSGNGFMCLCEKEFTGRHCEYLIIPSTTAEAIDSTLHRHSVSETRMSTSSSIATYSISYSKTQISAVTVPINSLVVSTKASSARIATPEYLTDSFSTTFSAVTHSSLTPHKSYLDSGQMVTQSNKEVISSSYSLDTAPSFPSGMSSPSMHAPSVSLSEPSTSSAFAASTTSRTSLHSSTPVLQSSSISTMPSSSSQTMSSRLVNPGGMVVTPPITNIPLTVSAHVAVDVTSTSPSGSVSPTSPTSPSASVSPTSPTSSAVFIPSVSITIEKPDDDGPRGRNSASTGKSLSWWVILVIVVGVAVVLGVLLVVVVSRIYQRRSDSRTLQNKPEMIRAFDREHFSAPPDFTNHTLDIHEDDSDDDIKHDIYVVNE